MRITNINPLLDELKQGACSEIIIINAETIDLKKKLVDITESVADIKLPVYVVFMNLKEEQKLTDYYILFNDFATSLNIIIMEII